MYLKIFASHPIQYHVPFYRSLEDAGIEIDIWYYHQGTAGRSALDQDFGISFEWDVDLLSGYPHHICLNKTANYSVIEQIQVIPSLLKWVFLEEKAPLLIMGWFVEAAWLIWFLCIITRKPVIILSETTPQSFAFHPKPFWRVRLLGWLLKKTQAVLYIGNRNRQFYEYMGVSAERLFHTPYSIDNLRFESENERFRSQKRKLREEYGLDPDLPVFLFCGKLIPKKRPLELLDAFLSAGLQDSAQLVYIGEGRLRLDIEKKAEDAHAKNVILLGFFNQTEMPTAYILGDVLCLISGPDETWGLVVNEALVSGLPVIVSDSIGCGPDLVSKENGWLVPLDDQRQLTRTLGEAYNHKEEWPKMGLASKHRVYGYNFSSMATGVLNALQSIL